MKNTFKYNVLRILTVLWLMMSTLFVSGQIAFGHSDEFFNDNIEEYNDRSETNSTAVWVATQNFGDAEPYVPVNNGLIILSLSAFGYLAYKGRKHFRKGILTVLLCASLIGMSGCHKENITPHNPDETIYVSFNPNLPTRTDITPLGIVTFSENDILHVFASGNRNTQPRYLGTLTNGSTSGNATEFAGNIYPWESGEKLSFFYLGNNSVNKDGATTIDFSDQTYVGTITPENDLDNISNKYHIARFQVTTPDDAITRSFSGQLKNMMALAVFDVSGFNDGTNIKILSESNLNNMMKINLDGSIEYCVAGINTSTDNQSGHIVIGTGSSNRYIALLPKSESEGAEVSLMFTSNKKVGTSNVTLVVNKNSFIGYSNGSVTPIVVSTSMCPDNEYVDYPSPAECMANPHVFTVMVGKTTPSNVNTVKKVVFSQGNLVYDQGRFKQHKNGWDVCPISNNEDIKVNTTFDRFGWASSGYTFGQPIYQPYSNSTTQYGSSVGYGYGALGTGSTTYKQSFHPHPTYRKQDWGWYQFGMNCFDEYEIPDGWTSYWRTMGSNEWAYLFNSRSTTSTGLIDYSNDTEVTNARFVKAKVEGQNGVIIFPDTYVHPTSIHLKYINSNSVNGLNDNLLSAQDFAELHNAGAEFLPLAGCYDKINETIINASGQYWSCKTQTADKAIYCKINTTEGINTNTMERYQGLFVRLVFQVEGVVE